MELQNPGHYHIFSLFSGGAPSMAHSGSAGQDPSQNNALTWKKCIVCGKLKSGIRIKIRFYIPSPGVTTAMG